MPARGIRGAIDVERDEKEEILSKTGALLRAMIAENGVKPEDVASAFFSLTPDLKSEFPAIAARRLGWTDVPLMCCSELDVEGAMKKVVRILLLVNTSTPASKIRHQYLGNTPRLRPDLAAKGAHKGDRR
jgi:chorismate mutase